MTAETLFIEMSEAGLRIDKLLALHFPERSRSYFQFLLTEGAVRINGQLPKKRQLVKQGDEVELFFLLTPELSATPEPIPLDILWEDDYLLAVNKPAGMVVHPAIGHPTGTFVNALMHHLGNRKDLLETSELRPGIVHRLDKDTSGVLLAAKQVDAHAKLIELFASRSMQKSYLAITYGKPKEGWFEASIGRHPKERAQMCIDQDNGKPAESHIEILDEAAPYYLVRVRPKSGRTHQIRVHLAALGAPVVGDPLYGNLKINQRLGFSGQLLHAHELCFTHPCTGLQLSLSAPLHLHLIDALAALKLQKLNF